ncbi:MAG TPA: TetR/AcrR family transcriptional regulator [Mobilitalea sp.]|nr:TetR/AcrR family transcriptional regulator [Mobilitalea sp.]
MEDKRVKKTKKTLKQTLITLLDEKPFEQISIKELCDLAEISRITFYTHYSDKYELIEEIFQDMINLGTEDYNRIQSKNNASNNPIIGYCNMLDSIFNLYYDRFDFFRHTIQKKNPYLAFSFYNYVMKIVETHAVRESKVLIPKYSPRKITSFLCYGLCGFINESLLEKRPIEEIREEAKEILKKILETEIFTKNLYSNS